MPRSELGFVFSFAAAFWLLLLSGRPVFADSDRHGRCHQHRSGPFSEWSDPDNLGQSSIPSLMTSTQRLPLMALASI